jgi:hypothetical protein
MSREFWIGIGIAAVFGFLPFAVKEMPQWLAWPGVVVGRRIDRNIGRAVASVWYNISDWSYSVIHSWVKARIY